MFGRRLYLRDGQVERIGKLLMSGFRGEVIAETVEVNPKTVYRARRVLEYVLGRKFKCECGKVSGHIGSCSGIPRGKYLKDIH